MRKITPIFLISVLILLSLFCGSQILAVTGKTSVTPTVTSVSPTIVPTVVAEVSANITEPEIKQVRYDVGKWNGFNTIRILIKWAMTRGVATNTIVLLLMLPLIATLVSVLHYIFGLTGYGTFMPTMIAITFLATGIFGGLLLFAMILIVSLLSNLILRRLRIHFWPARSINLLFISLGTFGLMLITSFFKLVDLSQISIFPILFMVLLAEEFVRTQLVKSRKEARSLTVGTLILAIFGSITMNFNWIQNIILYNPELMVLMVLIINLVVGNYTGIRLAEFNRFKSAIRDSNKKK
ncbi:MAG: 7TM domain-containing protein [Candidatus Shapirobacteria bacterium]|nr:7TM domain-containing protein [Candidatus Shapirobacteria bacterium]